MFLRGRIPLVPLAFAGFLLLILPSCLASDEFEGGNVESQDGAQEPRLVRRNFLRFGKRNGGGSDLGSDSVAYMKRESDNGPGEVYEQTVVGVHPHRSSPRSFLRFGKRSSLPALLRPEPEKVAFFPMKQNDLDEVNEIPYTAEELEEMLMKKRADNFLRFGKRFLSKQDLKDRLVLMALNDEAMNKRSKDFLRFG